VVPDDGWVANGGLLGRLGDVGKLGNRGQHHRDLSGIGADTRRRLNSSEQATARLPKNRRQELFNSKYLSASNLWNTDGLRFEPSSPSFR
jgi:hypothetical protein